MGRKTLLLRGLAVERFKKADKELHEVAPAIFLGSCGAAYNVEGIAAAGVTHVLCVAANLLDGIKAAHAAAAAAASTADTGGRGPGGSEGKQIVSARGGSTGRLALTFLEIEVEDKPGCDITTHFPACFAFIETCLRGGGRVLVHCFQGKSRSASVVVGYLMQTRGLAFEDALAVVKRQRAVAAPNIGFALQLRKFERELAATGGVDAGEQPVAGATPTLTANAGGGGRSGGVDSGGGGGDGAAPEPTVSAAAP